MIKGVLESKKALIIVTPNSYNLKIGGVAQLIPDKNTLASRLNISPSSISVFEKDENDISAFIETSYIFPSSFISLNISPVITFIKDEIASSLESFTFEEEPNLELIRFSNISTAGRGSIIRNDQLRIIELEQLSTLIDALYTSYAASTIFIVYIPNASNIGTTSGNDSEVWPTPYPNPIIELYVHPDLATINSGNPDGNIVDIQNRGAKVIYVQNKIKPAKINNISIANIFNDSVEFSFNTPNSNNNIQYYEIESNGFINFAYINSTVIAAKGLQDSTVYNFRIRAVDIYYNKGEWSDFIQTSTNTTIRDFPISQTDLIFDFNSENRNSYTWKSEVVTDLVSARTFPVRKAYYHESLSFLLNETGPFFNTPITIPVNSDVTFSTWVKVVSWSGGNNPGFLRDGSYFFIFQGSTGRPWIRWGSDILRPTSGDAVQLHDWIYISYVIKSGQFAKIYYGDTEKYSVNTTRTTPALSFDRFSSQLSENVKAIYKSAHLYTKALTQSEIANNYAQLKQKFRIQ